MEVARTGIDPCVYRPEDLRVATPSRSFVNRLYASVNERGVVE